MRKGIASGGEKRPRKFEGTKVTSSVCVLGPVVRRVYLFTLAAASKANESRSHSTSPSPSLNDANTLLTKAESTSAISNLSHIPVDPNTGSKNRKEPHDQFFIGPKLFL
jgi:hypothetical protein